MEQREKQVITSNPDKRIIKIQLESLALQGRMLRVDEWGEEKQQQKQPKTNKRGKEKC
jgi:hypothetical protein